MARDTRKAEAGEGAGCAKIGGDKKKKKKKKRKNNPPTNNPSRKNNKTCSITLTSSTERLDIAGYIMRVPI